MRQAAADEVGPVLCRHPASGYVQGINDLLTPFLAAFLSEHFPGHMDTWCATFSACTASLRPCGLQHSQRSHLRFTGCYQPGLQDALPSSQQGTACRQHLQLWRSLAAAAVGS